MPVRPSTRWPILGLHCHPGVAVSIAAALMLTSLVAVQGDGLRLEYDANMQSRVVAAGAAEQALGPFMHSETLLTATGELSEFALEDQHEDDVHDSLGDGVRVTLTGHAGQIAKIV